MLDKRKAPTAAARAHSGIRDRIITGIYAPGSMLSENDLAADLEMSRTPVRTALARLQDEGWVTIYAQRGALVRDFTAEEMRESAEFLQALETAGVQRAGVAQRAQMAHDLEPNLARQLEALKAGDFSTFAQLAIDFHRAFVAAAGNSLMLAAYDRLRDRQNMVIAKSGDRLAAEPDEVVFEHRAMMEYACAGDWVAFDAALSTHRSMDSDPEGPARRAVFL